ncbi:acyl-CoA dehydrogenase [Streptomyces caniscabiei]|uniref:acyl-CoA dehydrogenase family protein n=1 Tax=Streptomyces caniscabiei TaxID=2746961 RepID=UPI0029B89243|nr:acyl-CoA dehydrogenase [Streptomyces caniscabiei]MDX2599667.1 acyl-CoA dehydrogenase [Streptomyces caniscabiei]MDX2735038.1 acyl-CoA dehydrogenase [Streptomyces caniscabiei]MDX2776734.1 acyl-CoA dehydrogenase [Streptomyces caniscabiei]
MRSSEFAAAVEHWSLPGGPFDPVLLNAHDEAETFPTEACTALDRWGLPNHYVPAAYGGRLERLDEMHTLLRAVASRDLTVAVAHGKTFLGAASVWASGGTDAGVGVARHIAVGEAVAWGLTEPGGGSDLLAGELVATRQGSGWRLSGRKWPVNNATRGRFVTVLARTDPKGGPRGFSVFLVDKSATAPGSVRPLPKMPTHGIRGADISGVEFRDARVPGDALVGTVGGGLELVIKALQLTRIACVALSLGAGDHGLRLARSFLLERRLHGRALSELPHARVTAGQAVARLLLAEAVSYTAARAVHEIPEELSVVSAVTKALVPTLVQGQLRLVAELLGARSFLTEVEGYGGFAKVERDHQIVSIFDGSTWVNRSALASSLPLLRPGRRPVPPERRPASEWLSTEAEPTPLDPLRLGVMTRGDSILSSLSASVARLAADPSGGTDRLANKLLDAYTDLSERIARVRPSVGPPDTPTMRLSERYEWCFAGAAAIALWLANPQHHDRPGWREGMWLRGCLALVLSGLGVRDQEADSAFAELCDHLLDDEGAHLSLFGRPAAVPA